MCGRASSTECRWGRRLEVGQAVKARPTGCLRGGDAATGGRLVSQMLWAAAASPKSRLTRAVPRQRMRPFNKPIMLLD